MLLKECSNVATAAVSTSKRPSMSISPPLSTSTGRADVSRPVRLLFELPSRAGQFPEKFPIPGRKSDLP
uniref:hypothetical protein n=1 Tax=Victivallis sp. TaxID=2049020 RepID=UPI003A949B34